MKSYTETVNKRAQEANAKPEDTELASLRVSDDASKAVQKTEHRVSLDSIVEKIVRSEYLHPNSMPHMTICILTLENGFAFVGKSTPADPENFNKELGAKFAYEDAVRQVWPMEAYLLREKLSSQ